MLQVNKLAFAGSEGSDITLAVLLTAHERFRRKLTELVRPQRAKSGLARYCKHSATWVSNLLVPRAASPQIGLDDLENIATYFGISLGELLGAAKPGELSGDEQRLVHAFRALPPAMQEHFLALIESASLGAHLIHTPARVARRPEERVYKSPASSREVAHGGPLSTDTLHAENVALRAALTRVSTFAATAATSEIPDRPVSSTRTPEADRR